MLDDGNTSRDVYADKGYPSAARSEMLKALGYREHIQRKAPRGKPLSECQKKRNTRIARTRARVEHPLRRYSTWAASSSAPLDRPGRRQPLTMMATCYNLKRLAGFLKDRVDAFYKAATSPSKSETRLKTANA